MPEILCCFTLFLLYRVTIYVGLTKEYIGFHVSNFINEIILYYFLLPCVAINIVFVRILYVTIHLLPLLYGIFSTYSMINLSILLLAMWFIVNFFTLENIARMHILLSSVCVLLPPPFIVFLPDNLEVLHAVSPLLMVTKDTLPCILN